MQHEALITALGGPGVVAALCGVSVNTPVHWKTRGIPAPHWPRLVRAARRHGLKVSIEAIAEAAPQYPVRETAHMPRRRQRA